MANEIIKLTSPTNYTQVTKGVTGSILTQKSDGDIAMIPKETGWGFYVDSTYTDVSPLVINNDKIQITCDGLGGATNTTELPARLSGIWNTTTNVIDAKDAGDSFGLRFTFKATAPQNGYFDIGLDIGTDIISSPIVIASETKIHPKGAGVVSTYSFDVPIFSLSTFVTNGGKLFVDTRDDAIAVNVHDINVLLVATHRANSVES